ncbi:MAG: hypothetical protein ACRC8S_13905 [Fimbriiglobus sp.]
MSVRSLILGAVALVGGLVGMSGTASAQHFHGHPRGHVHPGHVHPGFVPNPVIVQRPVVVNHFGFTQPAFTPVYTPVVVGQSFVPPHGLPPGFATHPAYRTYHTAPAFVGFAPNFAPGFGPGFGPGFNPGFGNGFAPGFGPGFGPSIGVGFNQVRPGFGFGVSVFR